MTLIVMGAIEGRVVARFKAANPDLSDAVKAIQDVQGYLDNEWGVMNELIAKVSGPIKRLRDPRLVTPARKVVDRIEAIRKAIHDTEGDLKTLLGTLGKS